MSYEIGSVDPEKNRFIACTRCRSEYFFCKIFKDWSHKLCQILIGKLRIDQTDISELICTERHDDPHNLSYFILAREIVLLNPQLRIVPLPLGPNRHISASITFTILFVCIKVLLLNLYPRVVQLGETTNFCLLVKEMPSFLLLKNVLIDTVSKLRHFQPITFQTKNHLLEVRDELRLRFRC